MKTSDYLTIDEIETIRGGGIVKVTKLEGLEGDELKAAERRNKAIRLENRVRGKINHKAKAKARRKQYWSGAVKDLMDSEKSAARPAGCSFGSIKVSGGQVRSGLKSYPIARCAVDLVEGGKPSRMTATRIGAGAVLAGPAGAIIGGMAKKDRSKTWVIVTHPGGTFQEEVSSKDKPKAVAFVRAFEAAQH